MMYKIKDWSLSMKTFWGFFRNQVSNIKSHICKRLFMKGKVIDRLFLLAYTDIMMGVKNRNAYEEALVKLRKDTARLDKIMVVVIDVDNLTVINNTHGHHLGDEVIKKVANCLLKTIGTKADVYRVGDDEFVYIAKYDISGYISEFRDLIGFENQTLKISFSVSLGYMKFNCKIHKSIDELIIECDKKMYRNKRKYKTNLK